MNSRFSHTVPMDRTIQVVGAVIVRDGQIPCVQRGPNQALPGMWEFPGGKVEPGEEPRAALVREIDEELGCAVGVSGRVTRTVHAYDFATVDLTTYLCELVAGEPDLREHAAAVWLSPERLLDLEWAPADIPAVRALTTINLTEGCSAHSTRITG